MKVFARFSSHGNSIHNIIPLLKKKYIYTYEKCRVDKKKVMNENKTTSQSLSYQDWKKIMGETERVNELLKNISAQLAGAVAYTNCIFTEG